MEKLPVKALLVYSGGSLNDVNWFPKKHRYGKTSLSKTPFPIGMH